MSEVERVESIDRTPIVPRATAPHPRAIGSPLPMGASRRPSAPPFEGNGSRMIAVPPGRGLPSPESSEEPSSVQRAVNAFRSFLPLVERVLPLLDGNIMTAVANVLAPRPAPPAPAPKIDLAPLDDGLSQLQTQHRNLREQVMEQNTSLKRVEDQLEMVREATDRNTLEQQELMEDLRAFSGKVKAAAWLVGALLVIGFVLNLMLYLHIQRVLP
jgi:hypothetical protein